MPRGRYPKLKLADWVAVAKLLPVKTATRPYADPQPVFETLLHVLWSRGQIRGDHGPGYCRGNLLSPTLWRWTLAGNLQKAWRAYLQCLPLKQVREWEQHFKFYEDSFRSRKEALKHAAKVHSLWFRIMADVLHTEARRNRR